MPFTGEASDWNLATSPNRWTDNELGLACFELWEAETRPKTSGAWRILLVDGDGSHVHGKVGLFCHQNHIQLIIIPPHTTDLFQLLNIGIFSPLQSYYSRLIL